MSHNKLRTYVFSACSFDLEKRVPLLDIHHGIFPSLPLDSVVWYSVYTCSERSDKHGYPLDWTGGTPSRGRRGNGALLRARGFTGGTAAPGLGLQVCMGKRDMIMDTREEKVKTDLL